MMTFPTDSPEEMAWEAMVLLWAELVARGHITLEATEKFCSVEGKAAWCQEFRRVHVELRQREYACAT
ncbi:hypothetical protein [uncultured Deinococcus sp.]|uniref:hypothetical protein n=1 Tax=uncultured Deinococcus sp. TaxID=158789 RepID=UPI00258FCDEE|nr:hypothetical protein [uncultured Deinococcus sp.]